MNRRLPAFVAGAAGFYQRVEAIHPVTSVNGATAARKAVSSSAAAWSWMIAWPPGWRSVL